MKKALILLSMAAGLLNSCSKDSDDESDSPLYDHPFPYQPMTTGSKWTYLSGIIEEQSTLSPSGFTLDENGISINQMWRSVIYGQNNHISVEFLGAKDHNYYEFHLGLTPSDAATPYPDPKNSTLFICYLNDTASVGYKFNHSAGTRAGEDCPQSMEIMEKGISLTVNGKQFRDVTHSKVQVTYTYKDPTRVIKETVTTHYYLAKNIGLIKKESIGTTDNIKWVTTLKIFDIKKP